jgi:hypothetical protein
MKTNVLGIAAFAIVASSLLISSCKKTDVTPPVVTLNGASSYTISLQSNYTELNATALDDQDGAITPSVSGTVNTNLTGDYVITYTATDKAGNIGTAKRTITVANDANIYSGTYACADTAFGSFSQTVTASTTLNNHIVFSMFADRTGNNTIEAVITGGSAFTLVDATVTGLGANGCTFKYTANGAGAAITASATGKYSFSVKYFEEKVAGGAGCLAVAPTPFEDTFVQQ